MGIIKKLGKKILPPFIADFLKLFLKKSAANEITWTGSYESWNQVIRECSGYDDKEILTKTKDALLKVKAGLFSYERDSVLFEKLEIQWPLVACLQKIALETPHPLSVLDFGGSLGSTFFQNKSFMPLDIEWSVVEQNHIVECGSEYFEDEVLKFYQTIDQCKSQRNPQVLLLGSVLPYVEDPIELIKKILFYKFSYIIIDRTSFTEDPQNRLTLQTVPSEIYGATYPCWFFNQASFISLFKNKYEIISEIQNDANPLSFNNTSGSKMYWTGFFLKLKK
jgi:putative methyltransferase (TIGR04325 family)